MPDRLQVIRDVCDEMEEQYAGIADAYTVLTDDEASPEAKSLAMRTLDRATQGYTQLLDEIRKRATRMHEEIETLHKQDVA